MKTQRDYRTPKGRPGPLHGIVIHRGPVGEGREPIPRISAFIWGGKVRPTPTLPFGRWKDAA